ncbi:hypothetical protein [Microbacterium sp. SLBN-146]|uniref:hypothetical protein n=1 Tax=Microbacterium sp. SLBN-146 TaxID=2768457 RepID=UPI00114F0C65|nr:hypothetical protein [Microbacterium sp. SLBN-146]
MIAPAVAAGRIASNLCQIKGAGIANSEERPYMPPEVLDSIVARARHRTARAGLIYQHAAEERSRLVAERMDALASGASAVARLEAVVQLGIPALTSTGR